MFMGFNFYNSLLKFAQEDPPPARLGVLYGALDNPLVDLARRLGLNLQNTLHDRQGELYDISPARDQDAGLDASNSKGKDAGNSTAPLLPHSMIERVSQNVTQVR